MKRAFTVSLNDGGARLLLLRRALEIEFVLLSEAEQAWLAALASGKTLAEATLASSCSSGVLEISPSASWIS